MANPDVPLVDEPILAAWGADMRSRGVLIFPDEGTRDLAWPTPDPGQLCYVETIGRVQVYRGTAWANLVDVDGVNAGNLTLSGRVVASSLQGAEGAAAIIRDGTAGVEVARFSDDSSGSTSEVLFPSGVAGTNPRLRAGRGSRQYVGLLSGVSGNGGGGGVFVYSDEDPTYPGEVHLRNGSDQILRSTADGVVIGAAGLSVANGKLETRTSARVGPTGNKRARFSAAWDGSLLRTRLRLELESQSTSSDELFEVARWDLDSSGTTYFGIRNLPTAAGTNIVFTGTTTYYLARSASSTLAVKRDVSPWDPDRVSTVSVPAAKASTVPVVPFEPARLLEAGAWTYRYEPGEIIPEQADLPFVGFLLDELDGLGLDWAIHREPSTGEPVSPNETAIVAALVEIVRDLASRVEALGG